MGMIRINGNWQSTSANGNQYTILQNYKFAKKTYCVNCYVIRRAACISKAYGNTWFNNEACRYEHIFFYKVGTSCCLPCCLRCDIRVDDHCGRSANNYDQQQVQHFRFFLFALNFRLLFTTATVLAEKKSIHCTIKCSNTAK